MKKIWTIPLFLSLILVAPTVEGGILSSLTSFFGSSVGQANLMSLSGEGEQIRTNSQNIDLLESVADIFSASSSQSDLDTANTNDGAVLPEVGPLGTMVDIKDNQPPSDLISVYTVHPGDTLGTVAEMYNVSVNTIRLSNDLKKGDVIRPGDNLVILPITGIKLTVKSGDTIESLAKKYHGNVEEIVAYNDLDPAKGLKIGDTIIIPDGEESVVVSTTKSSQTAPTNYIRASSYAGYYMRPVNNSRRTQGLHGYNHNAVDLAASVGTPIYASASGKVIIAKSGGWNGGYGNYIVISHPNGTQTLYAHLSSLNVNAGQKVNQGDKIGGMGSTGKSTGSHLHFEVRGAANPF